jgi:hypothetical protein
VRCNDSNSPYLLDLPKLKLRELDHGSGDPPPYVRIGLHWLWGEYPNGFDGHPRTRLLNWHTGEVIDDDSDLVRARDLDDPKAREIPSGTWGGVYDREGDRVLRRLTVSHDLVLDERGMPRLRLSECARDCSYRPSLSAGIASWPEGAKWLKAYDARSRTRFSWRFPEAGGSAFVLHTRRYVLVGAEPRAEHGLYWVRVRK